MSFPEVVAIAVIH